MKTTLVILLLFTNSVLLAQKQSITISIDGKKLTLLDSIVYQKLWDESGRNFISFVDSINIDEKPTDSVRFVKTDSSKILEVTMTYGMTYIRGEYKDRVIRPYESYDILIDKPEITSPLKIKRPYDVLHLRVKCDSVFFYGIVKLYTKEQLEHERKMLNAPALDLKTIQQLHFIDDSITSTPILGFVIERKILGHNNGHYFNPDSLWINTVDSTGDIFYPSYYDRLLGTTFKGILVDSLSNYLCVSGGISLRSYLHKKYEKQIELFPDKPNKQSISKHPYWFILKLVLKDYKLPQTKRDWVGFNDMIYYTMQIGEKKAEIRYNLGNRVHYVILNF